MGKSDTLDSMDFQTMNVVKSLQQFKDELTILPDRTRLLMKALGPLYTTYLKMDMGLKSIKQTMSNLSGETDEMSETFDEAGESVEGSTGSMAGGLTLLTAAFAPLTGVLALTKGLFVGLIGSLLPIIGLVFGVMAAVMLLVAIFDQGGGSLRKWLEDLPLIGTAFENVQIAVDKVKEAFGKIDFGAITAKFSEGGAAIQEMFGPAFTAIFAGLADSFVQMKDRILATWELIKSSVTLPELDGEGFISKFSEVLTAVVEFYFLAYNAIYDSIFLLVDAVIEAGFFQTVIDTLTMMWDSFNTIWDLLTDAIGGGGGIGDFIQWVSDLWAGLVSFLVDSGMLAFLMELIGFIFEWYMTIAIIAAKIIAIVIKVIKFLYPYIAPYARMLIAYIGFVMTIIMGAVRIVMAIVRAFMAVLRGDFTAAGDHIASIGDIFMDTFEGVKSFFKKFVNALIDFVSPLFDMINAAIAVFNSIPLVPNLPKINYQSWKMEKGGIMSGPRSGYPVELHGTEAVVPLPDGRSIPVTVQGGVGGSGETTININVEGANGDARKIARLVGDEVGRLFKTRSRGSGFSRGL